MISIILLDKSRLYSELLVLKPCIITHNIKCEFQSKRQNVKEDEQKNEEGLDHK